MTRDIDGVGVTMGNLAKITAAVVFVAGYSVAIYSFVSSISHRQDLLKTETEAKIVAIEKQTDSLATGQAENSKAIQDLTTTLARTNAILDIFARHYGLDPASPSQPVGGGPR